MVLGVERGRLGALEGGWVLREVAGAVPYPLPEVVLSLCSCRLPS